MREEVPTYSVKGGHVPGVGFSLESGDDSLSLAPASSPGSPTVLFPHSRAKLDNVKYGTGNTINNTVIIIYGPRWVLDLLGDHSVNI